MENGEAGLLDRQRVTLPESAGRSNREGAVGFEVPNASNEFGTDVLKRLYQQEICSFAIVTDV